MAVSRNSTAVAAFPTSVTKVSFISPSPVRIPRTGAARTPRAASRTGFHAGRGKEIPLTPVDYGPVVENSVTATYLSRTSR
ncbi:hypothetical protein Sfulv_20460 [Streptomyces fulvorobeus]|uniref:Uncharacterized protein n=1 Tax=Streptomyces fulvorobeus TaxID=284028 RepID=A0A7J0C3Z1_9ACTN|nr:hypothetical protein Sfulv_20460 [Streptomyces fulvorobeus]